MILKILHSIRNQQGQSMIEVAIAALGLVMVLVAVVSGIMLSVRNVSSANDQSVATKYAQEGVEIFRRFNGELGYTTFHNTVAADGASIIYCIPNAATVANYTQFQALSNGACGTNSMIPGTTYYREVSVVVAANSITVTSVVRWSEGVVTNGQEEFRTARVYQEFRRR